MSDHLILESGDDFLLETGGTDQLTLEAVVFPATAVTLTGAARGAVGVPITLTVGANGSHPGFNYTPTSDVVGDAFSAAVVAVPPNSSATFTITAVSTGTRNVNGTNDIALGPAASLAIAIVQPALSVARPAINGFSQTQSGDFVVSLAHPGPGTTTATMHNGVSGSWSVPVTFSNPSNLDTTITANVKFTPTGRGASNLIYATGDNGASTSPTVNFPIFPSIPSITSRSSISKATLTTLGIVSGGDGSIGFKSVGSGNFKTYMAGHNPSPPPLVSELTYDGTLINPFSGGTATRVVNSIPSGTLEYVAGGNYLRLAGMTKDAVFLHDEEWPSGYPTYVPFRSQISIATTADNGTTFSRLGAIISPKEGLTYPGSDSADIGSAGCFVDDTNVYCFFTDQTALGASFYTLNVGIQVFGLAMCPRADFIAAINAGTLPVFTKYKSGSFSTAGLGGDSDSLIQVSGSEGPYKFMGAVSFHTETNCYVMVCANTVAINSTARSRIQIRQSYDILNWSLPIDVYSGPVGLDSSVIYASMTGDGGNGSGEIENPVNVYFPLYANGGYNGGHASDPTFEGRILEFDTVSPYQTIPDAPTIGVATAGATSASVAFTAPAYDGDSTITGYTATSSPGGLTGTGLSSPITVSGLTKGQAYTFTVHATNAIGSGPESAASNSVTPGTVPDAPTVGTAVPGNGVASVPFTAPADNGGFAITQYRVRRTPGGAVTSGITSSPATITSANGVAATFAVAALNSLGWSAYSAESNSVTPEAAAVGGVLTVVGSTLSVCASLPATYNLAGYAALSFVEIGELSDLGGAYGRRYRLARHSRVSSGQTAQRKTAYEFPPVELVMAWDQSDAGQDILRAASLTNAVLSFKVTKQDGSVRYFTAQVSRFDEDFGTVDNIVTAGATLLRQTDIVTDPA